MIDDPRLIRLRSRLAQRPPATLSRRPGTAEAAVSLVLRPGRDLDLLLIKRAEHEHDPWSGHIALPGGRRSPGDDSLLTTAVRETEEETDVAIPRLGTILGALDEVQPNSPRLPSIIIAPFVAGVQPGTTAQPDLHEVDAAIWVPVDALRAPESAAEILIELENERKVFPAVRYGPHTIWGLTHRIIMQFMRVLEEAGL